MFIFGATETLHVRPTFEDFMSSIFFVKHNDLNIILLYYYYLFVWTFIFWSPFFPHFCFNVCLFYNTFNYFNCSYNFYSLVILILFFLFDWDQFLCCDSRDQWVSDPLSLVTCWLANPARPCLAWCRFFTRAEERVRFAVWSHTVYNTMDGWQPGPISLLFVAYIHFLRLHTLLFGHPPFAYDYVTWVLMRAEYDKYFK